MLKYRWRVSFSMPGMPLTGPVQLGDITIAPAPPDAAGRSQSTGSMLLNLDDYVHEDAVRHLALYQLEAVAISAAATGGSVREPTVNEIVLETAEELEAAGQRTPFSGPDFTHSLRVIARPMNQLELARGYQVVEAFPPEERGLWGIAARWLWKANSDPNPYDYLLALWTSLSVLYGPHVRNGEQQAIERFVDLTIGNSAAQALASLRQLDLPVLGGSGLTLGKGTRTRPIASELQHALAQAVPVQDADMLKLILLAVYALRCALVHRGQAVTGREQEIRLVSASASILKEVIMHVARVRLGL